MTQENCILEHSVSFGLTEAEFNNNDNGRSGDAVCALILSGSSFLISVRAKSRLRDSITQT